jgi:hypothetical protein
VNDAEVTHYQQLDIIAKKQEHVETLERIAEEGLNTRAHEVTLQRAQTLAAERSRWRQQFAWTVLAVATVFAAAWGIWAMATSGPPKTPEQIVIKQKQDRWDTCVVRKDNVWFPDAANGEGLCLPKGQEPPK